jgi:hypothetical protein
MESFGVPPAPVAAPEKRKKPLDLKDPVPAAAANGGGATKASPAAKWAEKKKLVGGDAGYVLEDVPHLTDYLPQLPVRAPLPPILLLSRVGVHVSLITDSIGVVASTCRHTRTPSKTTRRIQSSSTNSPPHSPSPLPFRYSQSHPAPFITRPDTRMMLQSWLTFLWLPPRVFLCPRQYFVNPDDTVTQKVREASLFPPQTMDVLAAADLLGGAR